jgi:putative N6-adenine-specific DNA methylase
LYSLIATASFGVEAAVKREAARLGFEGIKASDGKVEFKGGPETIARANIWLRTADRVLLKMGEFCAYTFDELFEKTKALNWADIIPADGKFTVAGKSVKSTLFSVSDCQSIVKKAIVESMKKKYRADWFFETGAEYKVQVALLRDSAVLTVDTSGKGLHKRGYRPVASEAPLKETMAAALIDFSYMRKNKTFLDPMCGSGTIPIEAALIAKNIAPGLYRNFASEGWDIIPKSVWRQAREEAEDAIDRDIEINISGSDIDPKAIDIAKRNAAAAKTGEINFSVRPLKDVKIQGEFGVLIANPPYGERMAEFDLFDLIKIYKELGEIISQNDTWSYYVLTSYEEFEALINKKAGAKRKLYNGMIKTDYYQFAGKKP